MIAGEPGRILIVPGCDQRRSSVAAASLLQSRFAGFRDVRAAVALSFCRHGAFRPGWKARHAGPHPGHARRRRRRPDHAKGQHRGHNQAPGRNHPMRPCWRHRLAHRRCGPAQFGAAHWAKHIMLCRLPPPRPRGMRQTLRQAQDIWEYRRGDPRRVLRRLLRCLERPSSHALRHELNRYERMGKGQNLRRLVSGNNADPCLTTIWRDRANCP